MKLKLMSIKLMSLVLILSVGSVTNPVLARTQDNGKDPVEAALSNQVNGGNIYVANSNNQIHNFLGNFQNFVQHDLLSPVNNIIHSTLGGIQIPNLSQIWNQILNGSASKDPGAVLSETLENKTNGQSSYSIREDIGKEAIRSSVTEIANQATLSQTAQTQMAQIKQATQQDTQESVRLGTESQNLDVTQQILQNLSQQTALNSQVNERLLEEAQQARIDRAMNNTLTAQTAKELSAISTADRRKNIAAGNTMTQQAGLLMMPGGITLDPDTQ